MSLRGMKTKDIGLATGIKPCTIRKWLQLWKATGALVKRPLERGRPRVLTSLEVSVRIFSLNLTYPQETYCQCNLVSGVPY